MKIWKEHYRALERLVPNLGSMHSGERVILQAPECLDLEFDVTHRNEDGAFVALSRWFEHPSGDVFVDGGMEMTIDYAKKEARPVSVQPPMYDEAGCVLPPLDKSPDEALREWLNTLNKLKFKAKEASLSLG